MAKKSIYTSSVAIYVHKTNEIKKIVGERIKLCIVGFFSVASGIKAERVFCFGTDASDTGAYTAIEYPPIKIYVPASNDKIFVSSSDAVLKSYDEITFEFSPTKCLYEFIDEYIDGLEKLKAPIKVVL